jgi:hypothetical protein
MAQDDQFKKLIAHAKEYGYIFQYMTMDKWVLN